MRKSFAFTLIAAALVLTSACNAPQDSIATRAVEELGTKVADLEARVAQLEAGSAVAPGMPASGAAAGGGADAAMGAPTTTGFEGVYVRFNLDNSEAKLFINGSLSGSYSKNEAVYLDSMLNRGAVNRIGVAFSDAKDANKFEIQVKSRGDDRWNTVFNFTPTMQKLESSFDVPYLGAAQ